MSRSRLQELSLTCPEPHERKSVYIGPSNIPGAEEGVFARRTFLQGDLVSYFNGVKRLESQMFTSNMTWASLLGRDGAQLLTLF